MFLALFLVFTLIFTVFENILLAGICLVLGVIFMSVYQVISKKKIVSTKVMWTVVLAFMLAMGAFTWKEIKYYSKTNPPSFPPFSRGSFVIKNSSIVGTGMVADISNQGKYVFAYQGEEYLLYSKKEYSIGDQLWMVGRIQENTKKDGFSYRRISTGTFAVPLFSGSFDFNKWMKMKGWKGTIYEDNSISMNNEGGMMNNDRAGWIKQMKRGIQEKVIEVYGKNKISGLLLGMLIGDKSQIPESEYQRFIDSGLVHLIAVSGGNILMIVVFLQCILFFLPFYVRLGVILCTIVGYSLICGLDSSVFRAVLMGGMSMFAVFRGREVNIWRLLSISCIIMLIINPYFLVYDTGFLLSYSALIGIIFFQKNDKGEMINDKGKLKSVQKGLDYVYKSYIAPSIGASIGIFPIIIFFMGKINVLGIIGNLFVLPLVPFVMIYGFVSIWIYSVLKWERLLWIEKICIQYIYYISELLSQYGLYLMVSGLWFKYVVLLVCVVAFVMWRIKLRDEGTGDRG